MISDFEKFIPVHSFENLDGQETDGENFENCFTKIPNELAKANLKNSYLVDPIVLVIYALISRGMSVEGYSVLTIQMILDVCHYKRGGHKPKIFDEIVKAFLFLTASGYIRLTDSFNPEKIRYGDYVVIQVVRKNFLPDKNFTKLYWRDFDTIMSQKADVRNEILLDTFLYISAYIGTRPKDEDGNELLDIPSEHPEAFWQSTERTCSVLSISSKTLSKCLAFLTEQQLLVKQNLGYRTARNDSDTCRYPNIYVLNKDGFEQEIEWAVPIVKKKCDENGVEK